MTRKLHRERAAEAAMLAYRTGLSAAICRAWLEGPVVRSADAVKAAFLPDSDDDSIVIARSEIEAYALALVKRQLGGARRPESILAAPSKPDPLSVKRLRRVRR